MFKALVASFALLAIQLPALAQQPTTLAPSQAFNLRASGGTYADMLTAHYGNVYNIGLMSFDLSGLMASQGLTATLRLYHWANASEGAPFELLKHSEPLSTEVKAWDDRPATDSDPAGRFQLGAGSRKWYDVDVSLAVGQSLAQGEGEIGFTLQRADGKNPYAYFTARDGNLFGAMYAPQLVITSAVPEPRTYGLMLLGLGLLGAVASRRA